MLRTSRAGKRMDTSHEPMTSRISRMARVTTEYVVIFVFIISIYVWAGRLILVGQQVFYVEDV